MHLIKLTQRGNTFRKGFTAIRRILEKNGASAGLIKDR